MYQNTTEIVAYVETAKTSHASGERNCGHTFIVFGYGNSQYPSHGRPTWISGNMPAQTTAKIVIASAKRLIELRQVCLNSSRMAEISVPAWPIPIHHTKLMMAKPQATGMVTPQMPTPFRNSQVSAISSTDGDAAGDQQGRRTSPAACAASARCRAIFSRDRLEGVTRRDDRVLAGARIDHRVDCRRSLVAM